MHPGNCTYFKYISSLPLVHRPKGALLVIKHNVVHARILAKRIAFSLKSGIFCSPALDFRNFETSVFWISVLQLQCSILIIWLMLGNFSFSLSPILYFAFDILPIRILFSIFWHSDNLRLIFYHFDILRSLFCHFHICLSIFCIFYILSLWYSVSHILYFR